MEGTRSAGHGALLNAVLTGVSTLVVAGSAAGAAALLAHVFGRNASTDGFFGAYGVYLVLGIAAQAFRLVVAPELARAAAAGRLGEETRAWLAAFLLLAVAGTVAVVALAGPIGDALSGNAVAARVATRVIVWLVPAALAQLLAAIAASALAAVDDYAAAALAYAAGAVGSVVLFAALTGHGVVALAWGTALNGAITLAVPLVALARRGHLLDGRFRLAGIGLGGRLWRLVEGAAVPLAVQGLYVVALVLAGGLGEGKQTSLSFAYLIAAVLVTATASTLSLISSVPLTRRGLGDAAAATHVVDSSWLSLALIAAAAGVFALVGGPVFEAVLGSAYGGGVGRELGQLVVELAPWTIASVVYTLTFPLLFVAGRRRALLPLAVAAVAVHVPIALGLRAWLGLPGVAVALAVSTFLLVGGLLAALSPRLLTGVSAGLVRPVVAQAGAAAVAFGVLALVVGRWPAAIGGLALYALLTAGLWRLGLGRAWRYVRTLHE